MNCKEKTKSALQSVDYYLVGIRNAVSAAYGMITDAIHIPEEELESRLSELPEDKKIILYCAKGRLSEKLPVRQICLVENQDQSLSIAAKELKILLLQYAKRFAD